MPGRQVRVSFLPRRGLGHLFPASGGGAEDYLTMMRENTQRIATGLTR